MDNKIIKRDIKIDSKYLIDIPGCYFEKINIDKIKGMIDSGYYKFEPNIDEQGNLISIDLVKTNG